MEIMEGELRWRWECPSCLTLQNLDKDICTRCTNTNPAILGEECVFRKTIKIPNSISDTTTISDTWTCSKCNSANRDSRQPRCVICWTIRPTFRELKFVSSDLSDFGIYNPPDESKSIKLDEQVLIDETRSEDLEETRTSISAPAIKDMKTTRTRPDSEDSQTVLETETPPESSTPLLSLTQEFSTAASDPITTRLTEDPLEILKVLVSPIISVVSDIEDIKNAKLTKSTTLDLVHPTSNLNDKDSEIVNPEPELFAIDQDKPELGKIDKVIETEIQPVSNQDLEIEEVLTRDKKVDLEPDHKLSPEENIDSRKNTVQVQEDTRCVPVLVHQKGGLMIQELSDANYNSQSSFESFTGIVNEPEPVVKDTAESCPISSNEAQLSIMNREPKETMNIFNIHQAHQPTENVVEMSCEEVPNWNTSFHQGQLSPSQNYDNAVEPSEFQSFVNGNIGCGLNYQPQQPNTPNPQFQDQLSRFQSPQGPQFQPFQSQYPQSSIFQNPPLNSQISMNPQNTTIPQFPFTTTPSIQGQMSVFCPSQQICPQYPLQGQQSFLQGFQTPSGFCNHPANSRMMAVGNDNTITLNVSENAASNFRLAISGNNNTVTINQQPVAPVPVQASPLFTFGTPVEAPRTTAQHMQGRRVKYAIRRLNR